MGCAREETFQERVTPRLHPTAMCRPCPSTCPRSRCNGPITSATCGHTTRGLPSHSPSKIHRMATPRVTLVCCLRVVVVTPRVTLVCYLRVVVATPRVTLVCCTVCCLRIVVV